MHYKMLPVITEWLPADKARRPSSTRCARRNTTRKIVESRRSDLFFNKDRLGKTFGGDPVGKTRDRRPYPFIAVATFGHLGPGAVQRAAP